MVNLFHNLKTKTALLLQILPTYLASVAGRGGPVVLELPDRDPGAALVAAADGVVERQFKKGGASP